ncbi:MAG: hypothetical protein WBA68_00035, partial [Alteraurantiacibacter sp.]
MTSTFTKRFAIALLTGTAGMAAASSASAQEIPGDDGYECVLNDDMAIIGTTANADAQGEDALACGENADANGESATA